MTDIDHPRRTPLTVTDDESGIVLHDSHTGSSHRLNGVARDIWELCDGTRSRSAIAGAIAARFGIAPAHARRDVDSALAEFRHAGLILTPAPSAREGVVLAWAVATALGTTTERPPEGLSSVEWDALVRLAVDHGVMPLLSRCAAVQWRDDVPAIVRDRLDRQYSANAAAVRILLAELFDLLRELNEQGIAAITLKGPVMACLLYGAPELRQAGDLDVFVAPDHAARARDVLLHRGYEFRARRRTDALAVKASPAGLIAVDLQWTLARPVFRFPVTLEEVSERLTSAEVRGVRVRQPEPADYLRLLCAHASKHCWSSLIWIADLAAFIRAWGDHVDWNRLLDRAAAAGGEKQILLGLRLAGDVLQADLPLPVRERLRGYPGLDALVADVTRLLFAPAKHRTFQGSLGVVGGGIFYMRTRERLRDRLPSALHLVQQCASILVELVKPNHLDRAVIALPPFLGFLYFAIRPVRVIVTWSATRWHRPRRGDR